MDHTLTINGIMGEGGGQILRSSLALSLALGIPFRMVNIRANRSKPGLRPQHLACVKAAQDICGATVQGAELDSREIVFQPGEVKAGEYHFDIGTGGSVMLLLQAIIPPLLVANAPSVITVTGGTHVPKAPPFEFLCDCLFPRLEAMGPKLTALLKRIGYMKEGGGIVTVTVDPVPQLRSLHLEKQDVHCTTKATIYEHGQPDIVFRRQQHILMSEKYAELRITDEDITSAFWLLPRAQGSGNAVVITTRHCSATRMVFAEYLQENRAPFKVAHIAARHALDFLKSGCAVDYYLADQLLVPLALAGGGSFTVNKITAHISTSLEVIGIFMDCQHNAPSVGTRNASVAFTAAPRP